MSFLFPNRECKNRCDADLQWNDDARKACREACKTEDPPASGYDWLDSQRPEVQMLYNYEPNQVVQIQEQQAQVLAESQAGFQLSPGIIIVGLALLAGAVFLIRKAKK